MISSTPSTDAAASASAVERSVGRMAANPSIARDPDSRESREFPRRRTSTPPSARARAVADGWPNTREGELGFR